MIGFNLTPEQKALQEKAGKFARSEILPVAAKYDRDGTFPLDVTRKAYDEGLLTLVIPKKYGGEGVGILDSCIIYEELAAACMGIYLGSSSAHWPFIPL